MLHAHDPRWPAEFAALESLYRRTLGDLILRVEHVGSTAVPDLPAKPILDIDLVMRDYRVFPAIVTGLAALGYVHEGDRGIAQREAFRPKDGRAPLVPRDGGWMDHHLYVCPVSAVELQRHLRFRDALRASDVLRREYAAIKSSLAERARGDRRLYAELKERECGEFVERALLE